MGPSLAVRVPRQTRRPLAFPLRQPAHRPRLHRRRTPDYADCGRAQFGDAPPLPRHRGYTPDYGGRTAAGKVFSFLINLVATANLPLYLPR